MMMDTATEFNYEAADYSFGLNEAGWGMERWWHDGVMAYCLEAVGLVSCCPMTEAAFWALAEIESARLEGEHDLG